jgi:hypothetical protein
MEAWPHRCLIDGRRANIPLARDMNTVDTPGLPSEES